MSKRPGWGVFCVIIMAMEAPLFEQYSKLFKEHGHALYIVGGTSRDLILGLTPKDWDFATSATPQQEKAFLPEADYSFEKFGSIKSKADGAEVDITTLREEGSYRDFRHPSYIRFIASPEIDSRRRDFTINALYIDSEGRILDFHEGMKDLKLKQIRFIGDPRKRIEEDPLRILRAERFAKRLGFSLEQDTLEAIDELRSLLSKLNPEKIKSEERKG